jgi:hypothetical protein
MVRQVYQPPDIRKISQQGQQLFAALDPELRDKHHGQFIAIEVESSDYFIGKTAIEANQKARTKYLEKVFFLGRLGYRTAFSFKGR